MTTGLYKKGMVLGIIVLFLGVGVIPSLADSTEKSNIQVDCVNDEIDQQQTTESGERYFGEHFFCAQSFTPTFGKLTRIELQLSRHNKPPEGIELILRIRGNLDGKDITYIKKNPDEIQGDHVWVEFDFPDINVPPGEQRYIIINYSVDRHDIANCYRWYFALNNPYPLGDSWHFSYENGWEESTGGRDFCFKTYGKTSENVPPYKPTIQGPIKGNISTTYEYRFTTSDYDNDQIYYLIDWGDGNSHEWIGPFSSGSIFKVSHQWNSPGNYIILAKARDIHNEEGEWSDPLEVSMPKNKPIRTPFQKFPQNHPHLSTLLRQLLNLQ